MQLVNFIKVFCCAGLVIMVCGCSNLISSAIESGIVYIVAKHDETVEKKQKRYTATHKCVVPNEPEALITGDLIAYGQPLTAKYDIILSRTGEDIDPVKPHQLAFAFYLIADEIHDVRAKDRIAWLEKQIPQEDAREVRSIIADKFLASHLEKCFFVPAAYRHIKTTRDLIREEQKKLEQQNLEVTN